MAEPKWTAGPWLYQQNLLWRDSGKIMPEEILKLPDISGWIEGALNEDDEALANAQLISAAPELYAALVAAEEELRLLRMKDTSSVYNPALSTQMAIALAKARGDDQ